MKWLDPKSLLAARLRSFRNRLRAGYRGSTKQRIEECEFRENEAADKLRRGLANAERDKSIWLNQAQADFEKALGVLAQCRFEREVGCGTERVLTVRMAASMLYRARMGEMLPMFARMLARMVEKEVLAQGDTVRADQLKLMRTPEYTNLLANLSASYPWPPAPPEASS